MSGPINEKPSFPSGHATRATAAALTIAYILVRERMVPRSLAIPAALVIAAATGVSRAYADAHWTTDVVGGWALGGATAAASALWYEKLRKN
jgi:undecaprenyl-diphosphatase